MIKGFEWNGRVERTCDLRVADEPTGAVAPTLLTKKKNDAVPSHTAQRPHNPNNQIRNQNHVHSQAAATVTVKTSAMLCFLQAFRSEHLALHSNDTTRLETAGSLASVHTCSVCNQLFASFAVLRPPVRRAPSFPSKGSAFRAHSLCVENLSGVHRAPRKRHVVATGLGELTVHGARRANTCMPNQAQ